MQNKPSAHSSHDIVSRINCHPFAFKRTKKQPQPPQPTHRLAGHVAVDQHVLGTPCRVRDALELEGALDIPTAQLRHAANNIVRLAKLAHAVGDLKGHEHVLVLILQPGAGLSLGLGRVDGLVDVHARVKVLAGNVDAVVVTRLPPRAAVLSACAHGVDVALAGQATDSLPLNVLVGV